MTRVYAPKYIDPDEFARLETAEQTHVRTIAELQARKAEQDACIRDLRFALNGMTKELGIARAALLRYRAVETHIHEADELAARYYTE